MNAKVVNQSVEGVPGLTLRKGLNRCSWIYRYTDLSGRRREMGLGKSVTGSSDKSVEEVRLVVERVIQLRHLLAQGVDPIDRKAAAKEEANVVRLKAKQLTVKRLLRMWIDYTEPRQRWSLKYTKQVSFRVENDPPSWLLDIQVSELKSLDVIRAIGEMKVSQSRKDLMRQRLDWAFEWFAQSGHADANAGAVRRAVRGRFA